MSRLSRFLDVFKRRLPMIWTTPAYQDLRFGFEITMYISAR
jgi:coenzyme PQQ precursor peptide PqqA